MAKMNANELLLFLVVIIASFVFCVFPYLLRRRIQFSIALFSSLFSSLFGVVTSPSSAFGSFVVDAEAAGVVSASLDDSVVDDASDATAAAFVVAESVVLFALVVTSDDSSLLLSPDRVSNATVEVSTGVVSLAADVVAAAAVVDGAELLVVSPPLLVCVVVRNESLGSAFPAVVLTANGVDAVALSF